MSSIKINVDKRMLVGNSLAQDLVDEIAQREDEIQQREDEIRQLKDKIKQMKTRLNAALPMGHIPDVIWEEIFFQLIRDTHISSYVPIPTAPVSVNGTYAQWIRITLVCRRWKDLILNTPRLWSFVEYTNNPACMRSVLAQSKSAPIQILSLLFGHVWNEADVDAVKELISHLHRSCQFYLVGRGYSYGIMESLERTVVQAPWLRSMHLSRLNGDPYTADNVPLLSNSDFPCLQELDVSDCSLQVLQAAARPSVTPLAIKNFSEWAITTDPQYIYHDTTSILDILRGMPLLRSFLLQDWDFNPFTLPSDGVSAAPHVQLPHLQSLRIKGFSTAIAGLLDHLAFPGSAAADITSDIFHEEGGMSSCEQFTERLKDLGLFSPPSMHHLIISPSDTGPPKLSGYKCATNRNVKPISRPSFSISLYVGNQLPTMLDIIPLEHVQELELKACAHVIFLFSGMTSLRSLTFCDDMHYFAEFIRYLSSPPQPRLGSPQLAGTVVSANASDDADPIHPRVLFPNLVHLEINSQKWYRFAVKTELLQIVNKSVLDDLQHMLTWRWDQMHQQTIKQIVLKGPFSFRAGITDEFHAQFPDVELVELFSPRA